jgi:uncharacterized protein YxjI
VLECNTFAITEHKKILSAPPRYAIKNAQTGEILGEAIEIIGPLSQVLRWVVNKQFLPITIEVREKPDDSLLFTIRRGAYWFRSRVEVRDANQHLVGYFHSRFFTLRGGFTVYDQADQPLAQVQGQLWGLHYKFLTAGGQVELAEVSKSIGGMGGVAREMLFSADNYFLTIHPDYAEQPLAKMLLLAAALAIDIIYTSESRGTLDPVEA